MFTLFSSATLTRYTLVSSGIADSDNVLLSTFDSQTGCLLREVFDFVDEIAKVSSLSTLSTFIYDYISHCVVIRRTSSVARKLQATAAQGVSEMRYLNDHQYNGEHKPVSRI